MARLLPGIGRIAVGVARQGFDLQLTRYDERGWRAIFYTTGMERSRTSATGTGWEQTPWKMLKKAEESYRLPASRSRAPRHIIPP
jgi:hypothetical protein